MSDDRAFERAMHDWLDAGSDRTPPAAVDAVLLAVRTTPQERDLPIPWRTSPMRTPLRLAAVIAIVAIAGVAVYALLGRVPSTGTTPSPTPSISTSAPASVDPLDTTSWRAFTSSRHGYSARYPSDWTLTQATMPATLADMTGALGGVFDHVKATGTTPEGFQGVSTMLPAGMTEAEWIAAYRQPVVDAFGDRCFPAPEQWMPVTVDGHAGGLYVGCNYVESTTFVDGRAYVFTVVEPFGTSATTSDEALLRAFLGTVRIDAAAADDRPPIDTSAWSPFESTRHGYSIKVPSEWTATPGTASWPFPPGVDYPPNAVDEFLPVPPDPGNFTAISQAIPAGTTDDQWLTQYVQDPFHNGCFDPPSTWETIDVAGHAGRAHGGMTQCNFTEAVVIVGGRAYVFTVSPNRTAISGVIYDRALFNALLSTVVFAPEQADDTPAGG